MEWSGRTRVAVAGSRRAATALRRWAGTALDLDERRYGILVEKEVINRPAAAAVLLGRKRCLTRNELPTTRGGSSELIASEQTRVLGQQLLKNRLRVVRPLEHLHELISIAKQVDPAAHGERY